MKNEILDEPIQYSFFDYLEKGEKILWEDQTQKEVLISIFEIIPIVFFSSILFSFRSFSMGFFLISTFSLLIIFSILYPKSKRIKRQRETKYALTPKRIILQQYIFDGLIVDQIPLEYIARVSIETNHFNFRIGDIFLLIKDDKKGLVKTYHPLIEQPNPVPTIWQINNPKEVLKLINEQLKEINA